MGAGLVKACYDQWATLGDVPFRVLVFMAVTALDDDAEPAYWAGRDELAGALGRVLVDVEDTAPEATKRAARRAYAAVERALAALTEAGAVTVARAAAPGRNARYRLRLSIERPTATVVRLPATPHGDRGPSGTPEETPADGTPHVDHAERPTVGDRMPHAHRGAEEYEEYEEYEPKPLTDPRTAVTVPRANPTPRQLGLWPTLVDPAAEARQIARDAITAARDARRAAEARNGRHGPPGPADGPTVPQPRTGVAS